MVSIGPRVGLKLVQDFSPLLPNFRDFLVCSKLQIVSIERQTDKSKKTRWKKAKKIKRVFFRRFHQKMRKMEKCWFVAKIAKHNSAWKGEKTAFSCTLSVSARNFLGPRQPKTRKYYKNRGFSGNCLKPKMTPSF